jgi:hypothetical protein
MVEDNRSHSAYSFRRTGKKFGRLRWSGYGYLGTVRPVEEIAAQFKDQPVSADLVRKILSFATAHLFIEMVPHHGGTGYHVLLPKSAKRPPRVAEPDDPREDEAEDGDEGDEEL